MDNFSATYLQFNPILKFQFTLNKVTLYSVLGPSMNYLLYSDGYLYYRIDKEFNWGYIAGAGININKILKLPVSFEIIYNPDIEYIYKDDFHKFKHYLWQFRMLFNLK